MAGVFNWLRKKHTPGKFTWLNRQGVRSSDGFELQRISRFKVEYRERGRVLQFYVESGSGAATIYEGSLQPLWSDIADPAAKASERARILTNVCEALKFQGLNLDLAEGDPPRYDFKGE